MCILYFSDTVKKKGGKKTNLVSIDSSYLACQYHTAMVAGLALVEEIQNFLGELTDGVTVS